MLKQLALATLVASTFTAANAYQAEVGGTLAYQDIDLPFADNGYKVAVDGTYYFAPVQVKSSPLNEAAFLNRASNVNAAITHDDYDIVDVTTVQAGVEYFVPNSDFYVNGQVGYWDSEGEDDFTYKAEVGYLPTAGLLVAAGLQDLGEDTDVTLRSKYVTKVSNYDVNFEAGVVFADDEAFNLGADVYLDPTLSVGLGYTEAGYDVNSLDDAFNIRAKKFFSEQVSVEGKLAFGDDINTYGIRAAYRF